MSLLSRPPARPPSALDPAVEAGDREELGVFLAGICAAVAGVIHLVVVPSHLQEAAWIGLSFLGLGLAQLWLAVVVARRPRPLVLLGAIGVHLVVVGLYVASRTVELPFLPPHDPGHDVDHLPVAGGIGDGTPVYPGSRIEEVGALDLLCLLAELGLLAALTALLPARWRSRASTAMVLVAVATVVLRLALAPG